MGLSDPTINFRAPQAVKDALHLMAARKGMEPGPYVRLILIERLVTEAALDLLKIVGLEEVSRRLSQPSPVHTQHSTTVLPEAGEQTSRSFVAPEPDENGLVTHDSKSGASVPWRVKR